MSATDKRSKCEGHRRAGSTDTVETDGQKDKTDRTALPAHAVDNCRNRPSQRSATVQKVLLVVVSLRHRCYTGDRL